VSDELPAVARIALRLLEEQKVSASGLSTRNKALFAELIVSGVLKIEGSRRGQAYVVVHADHLSQWVKRKFPQAAGIWTASTAGAQNLLYSRDTKSRARGNRTLGLLFRGWAGAMVQRNGHPLNIADMTQSAGAAAVALGPNDRVEFAGACAVVENPELFWQAGPRCGIDQPLVLFKDGRASFRLIDWMRQCPEARFVLHVDFDPVGLDEYRRIREAVGDRASLYLPTNLGELFAQFGNRKILTKSSNVALLTSLRTQTDPDIQAVIALVDQNACVLEQEAVLVASLLK
jgi:hypothetical protein